MTHESIDGLCKQGTDIEGQFGVTAADALIEKQSACDNHRDTGYGFKYGV